MSISPLDKGIIFAATGDKASIETDGGSTTTGFDASYVGVGGKNPKRQTINFLINELQKKYVDILENSATLATPYIATFPYKAGALVYAPFTLKWQVSGNATIFSATFPKLCWRCISDLNATTPEALPSEATQTPANYNTLQINTAKWQYSPGVLTGTFCLGAKVGGNYNEYVAFSLDNNGAGANFTVQNFYSDLIANNSIAFKQNAIIRLFYIFNNFKAQISSNAPLFFLNSNNNFENNLSNISGNNNMPLLRSATLANAGTYNATADYAQHYHSVSGSISGTANTSSELPGLLYANHHANDSGGTFPFASVGGSGFWPDVSISGSFSTNTGNSGQSQPKNGFGYAGELCFIFDRGGIDF